MAVDNFENYDYYLCIYFIVALIIIYLSLLLLLLLPLSLLLLLLLSLLTRLILGDFVCPLTSLYYSSCRIQLRLGKT